MTKEQIYTLVCCIITFILSLLSSIILDKIASSKKKKYEKYNYFYKEFYKLWGKIHKGRAFAFTDLKLSDKKLIIDFFIENYNYVSKELQELIYVLKTTSLNDPNFNNEENKEICNEYYNKIINYMITKENEYRSHYNNIKY